MTGLLGYCETQEERDWHLEQERQAVEAARDAEDWKKSQERIAELEAALRPFAASAEMMKREERTDEDIAALTLGTDLTPSDFWQALAVMPKTS